MKCLVASIGQAERVAWTLAIENLGDHWRCETARDDVEVRALLRTERWDVLVLGQLPDPMRIVEELNQSPPSMPPFLLSGFVPLPGCDLTLPLRRVSALPNRLQQRWSAGMVPRLALAWEEQANCLSRGLLGSLGVPPRSHGWQFVPDMVALCAIHPPLMEDLTMRLYPLMARRHGMTPAGVERGLRLTVEATWNRGDLDALERFFGHSVDPERGKPTNKEFLACSSERIALACRRLDRP